MSSYTHGAIYFRGKVYGRNDDTLNSDLGSKWPVVLVEPNHFVVNKGSCATVGYIINDPGHIERTLKYGHENAYKNTYPGDNFSYIRAIVATDPE